LIACGGGAVSLSWSANGCERYGRPMLTVDEFLARPLVAHLATAGPVVRPVWFLWESGAFWWLTGDWSTLEHALTRDPSVALVIDSCDLVTGEVLQVSVRGKAEIVPWQREIAIRKLRKYLGPEDAKWPRERFRLPLEDGSSRLVRLRPLSPPQLRDLSFVTADAGAEIQ
jgi:nitroimidazol reductase NimA-like FMN-containing flavoprotein (pyridoxamine 5'-phosphate oxidase superfamily)